LELSQIEFWQQGFRQCLRIEFVIEIAYEVEVENAVDVGGGRDGRLCRNGLRRSRADYARSGCADTQGRIVGVGAGTGVSGSAR
jgi:hypothetical protein